MPDSERLRRLQKAIEGELSEAGDRRISYLALTHKMTVFQLGQGPAPTTAEFEAWRDMADQEVQMRRLLGGVPN